MAQNTQIPVHFVPFFNFDSLGDSDIVVIETANVICTYKFVSSEIVSPDAIRVIAPEPNQPQAEPTKQWLTMTTCHPRFSSRQRLIVHAILVERHDK